MPTPAIQSVLFFKQNDDGQNKEVILVASISGLLGTGADKQPVIIPQSNFATASDLATHLADLANPHQVTQTQVGLSNVLNVAQIPATDKGANSGVATLDVNGKLTAGQIPSSLVGGMVYQSAWNATANSPAIPTASADNNGWYYKVSVAGGTEIDGISEWAVGDWIVSNGTAWEKIDNTEAVSSVCGKTGAVSLASADIDGNTRVPSFICADTGGGGGSLLAGQFRGDNVSVSSTTTLSFYNDALLMRGVALGTWLVLTDPSGVSTVFEVGAFTAADPVTNLAATVKQLGFSSWTAAQRYTVSFMPRAQTGPVIVGAPTQVAGIGADGAGSLVSLAIGAFGGAASASIDNVGNFKAVSSIAGDLASTGVSVVANNTGLKLVSNFSTLFVVDSTGVLFTYGAFASFCSDMLRMSSDGSGGIAANSILVKTGTTFQIGGTLLDQNARQILTDQQGWIGMIGSGSPLTGADYPTDAPDISARFDAQANVVNSIIGVLRAHGLITSDEPA